MTSDATGADYIAAANEALAAFPVAPEDLTLFSVSENVTFLFTDRGSQQAHALRLHRPDYNTLDELKAERAWTAALADEGISVQRGVNARGDDSFVPVLLKNQSETRYAGLTHWLPGEPLGGFLEGLDGSQQTAARLNAFHQIGQLAAAMHNQSANWSPPPGFTRPHLDLTGFLGESPRWGRFWEHPDLTAAEGDLLNRVRVPLMQQLERYGMSERNFGLIHADLHPENIIVQGDQLSVIDFDDCAFGWFGYDLATALMEYQRDADAAELRATLLAGYREIRGFSAEDEDMLDTFLLLRGLATLGWFGARPEHAGSEYFQTVLAEVLKTAQALAN